MFIRLPLWVPDSHPRLMNGDIRMDDLGGDTDVSEDDIAPVSASSDVKGICCEKCTFIGKGEHARSLLRNHIGNILP